MAPKDAEKPAALQPTTAKRTSEREMLVTRTINGPARIVFRAWTEPELFKRWWVPKSFGLNLLSCELDVRVGGKYRLVFQQGDATMAFFGTYLAVAPHTRLSWTNEEDPAGQVVTTVTFQETAGKTLVTVHDLYPSQAALDAAISSDSTGGMPEQLEALDAVVISLAGG